MMFCCKGSGFALWLMRNIVQTRYCAQNSRIVDVTLLWYVGNTVQCPLRWACFLACFPSFFFLFLSFFLSFLLSLLFLSLFVFFFLCCLSFFSIFRSFFLFFLFLFEHLSAVCVLEENLLFWLEKTNLIWALCFVYWDHHIHSFQVWIICSLPNLDCHPCLVLCISFTIQVIVCLCVRRARSRVCVPVCALCDQ